MPRFVYNARTGELSGVTSIKVGDPQVSIQEYVTNYVASNKSQVYDSDLVAATLAKNFNTGGSLGFDSDQVVAIINENVVSGGSSGFDSDQIVAIISENVRGFQDSDESAVSILRNDLESDANFTNLKIVEIRNLLDSESSKVQSLKTRIFDTIKDNDSDHALDIQSLKQRSDSDENSFAGVKRFIRGENPSPNNIFEYYTDSGEYGSNPFHDSDLVIASAVKGFNVAAASYDSDRVVQTIITAGEIALKDYFLDSEEVFNMGSEHGWNFDSDKVMQSVTKNINSTITISGALDNLLDSEEVVKMFVEHEIATQSDIDSEIALIKTALDSETARIQLLLSNADSDQIAIAELRVSADSDTTVIQSLRSQAELDQAQITLIRNDLDSDTTAIQALNTRVDSDYARTNTKFASIEGDVNTLQAQNTVSISRLNALEANEDSDYAQLKAEIAGISSSSGFDSDQVVAIINENTTSSTGIEDSDLKVMADLRNDVDSDSIRIQDLQTQINNLVDDTGFDSDQIESMINEHVTPYDDSGIIARLDSDTTVIQNLQTQLDGFDVADIRARLDSDSIAIQSIRTSVDSDYALFNTKISLFNGLTDSDLTTVSILRNDLDSDSIRIQDHSTRIGVLEAAVDNTGFDSDQVVAIISENETAAFDDSIIVARLDSDSIRIQDHDTRIGVLEAAVDDTGFDSDQIESMINEHVTAYDDSGIVARLDSDSTIIQNLQTQISGLVDDTGFDSDQIESMINEHVTPYDDSGIVARLDSDTTAISARLPLAGGTMSGDIDGNGNKVLFANVYSNEVDLPNAGTYHGMFAHVHATGAGYFAHGGNWIRLSNHSDAALKTDLDSETARIQLLLLSTDSDALSIAGLVQEADSDAAAIAELLRQADSDAVAIQALKTDLTADINTLTTRVDSDETAIQAIRTDMDVNFNVGNSGASAYTFTGDGFPSSINNPTLYLERGHTYNFRLSASGHPFEIRVASGGSAYSTGVTNNGAQTGLTTFVVPMDAPESLVYQCTLHSGMVGTILIGRQGFDSDQIVAIVNENTNPDTVARLDSDSTKIQSMQGEIDVLRSDVDSDSVKIQLMQGSIAALESGTYNDAPLIARLDSDTTAISALRTELDGLSGTAAISTVVYTYTATQGQTTFTGADSNGLTLNYSPSKIYVFLNGILILDTTDYTATNGSSIVLTQAADSDNTLQVIKHVGTVQAGFDSDQVVAIISENQSASYNDAALVARLDSDTTAISALRTELDLIGQTEINIDTTGQSQTELDSFPTTVRSAEYLISASSNDSSWFASKIIVIHDGTNAYLTEYGVVSTHDSEFITFNADINSGNVRLLGTPSNSLTNVRMKRTTLSQS